MSSKNFKGNLAAVIAENNKKIAKRKVMLLSIIEEGIMQKTERGMFIANAKIETDQGYIYQCKNKTLKIPSYFHSTKLR